MGSVGAPELLVIFLVALIVLGPDRLPKMARQMGRAVAEFKRVTSGFEDEVRRAMDDATSMTTTTSSTSSVAVSETASGGHGGGSDDIPPPEVDRPVVQVRPVVSPEDLPPPPDDPSRN